MFGINALQYMVFFIIAIPPFFIGYFKGWRSALYSLILVVITGAILTGISFAIYDVFLWPLFKFLFLSSHNPANLDIQSLKEVSKFSVISISIGVGLIPCSLLFVGMYFISKKFLNKYMHPIIERISNNEVNISRKNLKYTRLGGVLINGSVGIIVASTTTGAISTLTTSANSSFFTKITNSFGDIMTFGQGQYDNDFQEIFELVNDGVYYSKEIDKFRELFALSQSNTGEFEINEDNFLKFNDDSTEHLDFVMDTNLIATHSERVSKALILMFLNTSKLSADLEIVGFNHSANNKDVIDTNDSNIDVSLEKMNAEIERFSNSLNLKWNQSGVSQGIRNFLDKRIVSFSDSPYFLNWKKQNDLLKKERKELKNKKNESSKLILEIHNEKERINSLVSLVNLNVEKIRNSWDKISSSLERIGKNFPTNNLQFINFDDAIWKNKINIKNLNNTFDFPESTIKDLSLLSPLKKQNKAGEFENKRSLEAIKNSKSKILEEKTIEWNKYKDKAALLKNENENENINLRSSKVNEESASSAKKELEIFVNEKYPQEWEKLINEKNDINKKIENLENDLNKLSADNPTTHAKRENIISEIQKSKISLSKIKSDQSLLNNELSSKNVKLKINTDIVSNEQRNQLQINSRIQELVKEMENCKENIENSYNSYQVAKNDFDKANEKYNKSNIIFENDEKIVMENNLLITKMKKEIIELFAKKEAIEEEHNKNVDRRFNLEDLSKDLDGNYNKESIIWEKEIISDGAQKLDSLEAKKNEMSKLYLKRKESLLEALVKVFS